MAITRSTFYFSWPINFSARCVNLLSNGTILYYVNEISILSPWRSVSQSVLASSPVCGSWPNFACSQGSCNSVCRGASSLSRGRVCHVAGHGHCLCQAIYTYVHFQFLFSIFVLIFSFFPFLPFWIQVKVSNVKVKLPLCLTKYHHQDVLREWRYSSTHSWPRH
jgi:hypothetical protein